MQNHLGCWVDIKPCTLSYHPGVVLGSPVLNGFGERGFGVQRFVVAPLESQGRPSACYPRLSTHLARMSFPFLCYFVSAQLAMLGALLLAIRGGEQRGWLGAFPERWCGLELLPVGSDAGWRASTTFRRAQMRVKPS